MIEEEWGDIQIYKGFGLKSHGVRIYKSGNVVFSKDFICKHNEDFLNKTHAQLGYSKSNNAIAIKFISEDEVIDDHQGINKLTDSNTLTTKSISIKKFLKWNYIDIFDVEGMYNPEFKLIEPFGRLLVIKINDRSIICKNA